MKKKKEKEKSAGEPKERRLGPSQALLREKEEAVARAERDTARRLTDIRDRKRKRKSRWREGGGQGTGGGGGEGRGAGDGMAADDSVDNNNVEARLREMAARAAEREGERALTLERAVRQAEAEERAMVANRTGPQFLAKQRKELLNNISVEEAVKRKRASHERR